MSHAIYTRRRWLPRSCLQARPAQTIRLGPDGRRELRHRIPPWRSRSRATSPRIQSMGRGEALVIGGGNSFRGVAASARGMVVRLTITWACSPIPITRLALSTRWSIMSASLRVVTVHRDCAGSPIRSSGAGRSGILEKGPRRTWFRGRHRQSIFQPRPILAAAAVAPGRSLRTYPEGAESRRQSTMPPHGASRVAAFRPSRTHPGPRAGPQVMDGHRHLAPPRMYKPLPIMCSTFVGKATSSCAPSLRACLIFS